jgi:ketosteroid isomerase-like protein
MPATPAAPLPPPRTPQEIFERHVWAGMTRNPDAFADLFTEDGVVEAPFAPLDGPYPRRVEGRDKIRKTVAAIHERMAGVELRVNIEQTRYVLHTTADPNVFIVEIDTAIDTDHGVETMPFVRIYRLRDGKIASLRDYFAPEHAY